MCMGESSIFSKTRNSRNSNFKTCMMPIKMKNFKFKSDCVKQINEAIKICLIQDFEADFLCKVSLNILNQD